MKRKRIAGVCITLAAVVLAGTFAVSGNNTKDKKHIIRFFQNIGKRKQVRVWM